MTAPLVPPSNVEFEQATLGAILLSDSVLPALSSDEGLEPGDFYRDQHRLVYSAMLALSVRGEPVDTLTVTEELRSTGRLEDAGGHAAIDLLAASVPAVGAVRQYARVVRAKAVFRRRIEAARAQLDACYSEDEEAFGRAIASADGAEHSTPSRIDPAEDFMHWYQRETTGRPTPFHALTAALGGGLVPGDVTVIGGWPGMGKTALAGQFLQAAHNDGAKCHLYLNEMHSALVTGRTIARMTDVPWPTINRRSMTAEQWSKAMRALQRLPAQYERIEGWAVERIEQHIRRHRWDVAVIDTATRIPHRDAQDLARVSGRLANVARETGCHLILVLQLNLERCKQAVRPSPTGRDLLGTGAWYQDARNVLFVHRRQEQLPGMDVACVLPDGLVYADKATHGAPEDSLLRVQFRAASMMFVEEVSPRDVNGNGEAVAADGYAEF